MILHNNKGQIRIVEAMITCVILIVGLSMSIHISSVYTVMESGNMEKAAVNILNVLENADVIEKIVNNDTLWKPEIHGLLKNLLPPDTFYNLTISSARTGNILGGVTNIAEWSTSKIDFISVERVVTISLPLGRSEYIPLDVMLVMDISGSMNDKLPGDIYTKIYSAKQAAKLFIDQLNASRDRVGIVTFSTQATLKMHLTNNFVAAKSTIDTLYANGWTDIGDGISNATSEFSLNGRNTSQTALVTILLSDGMANRPLGVNATQYAIDKAEESESIGVKMYTIGLGAKTDIDEKLLKIIVSNGGKYYYAPSADDLADIYTKIVQDLMFSVKYDVIVIELTLMKPR